MTDDDRTFIGIDELAARLGVSVSTVRAWRHKRITPPAYTFGKHVRWRLSHIADWIEAMRERDAS